MPPGLSPDLAAQSDEDEDRYWSRGYRWVKWDPKAPVGGIAQLRTGNVSVRVYSAIALWPFCRVMSGSFQPVAEPNKYPYALQQPARWAGMI